MEAEPKWVDAALTLLTRLDMFPAQSSKYPAGSSRTGFFTLVRAACRFS